MGATRKYVVVAGVVLLGIAITVIGVLYSQDQQRKQSIINQEVVTANTMGTLTLSSNAFGNNTQIPKKYTCQGDEVSPPLTIAGVPPEAKSLVLTMDDPDAPVSVWDHWVIWNITPDTAEIAENSTPVGVVGMNSSGQAGYQGPCPPFGMHRYRFTVYALSDVLSLAPGASKDTVLAAMRGIVLDQYTLVGLYQKS